MPLNEKTEADQKKVSKGADVVETKLQHVKMSYCGECLRLEVLSDYERRKFSVH